VGALAEEANPAARPAVASTNASAHAKPVSIHDMHDWPNATVHIEPLPRASPPPRVSPTEFFDPEDTAWRTHGDAPQPRPRPEYQFAVCENFEGEADENPRRPSSSITVS